MNRIETKAYRHLPLYRFVVFSLMLLSLALAGVYAALVGKTVYSVVERKNAQAKAALLGSRVSSLEAEYLSLTDRITPSYALERGYVVNTKPYFVVRNGLSRNLTLRNEI